ARIASRRRAAGRRWWWSRAGPPAGVALAGNFRLDMTPPLGLARRAPRRSKLGISGRRRCTEVEAAGVQRLRKKPSFDVCADGAARAPGTAEPPALRGWRHARREPDGVVVGRRA